MIGRILPAARSRGKEENYEAPGPKSMRPEVRKTTETRKRSGFGKHQASELPSALRLGEQGKEKYEVPGDQREQSRDSASRSLLRIEGL